MNRLAIMALLLFTLSACGPTSRPSGSEAQFGDSPKSGVRNFIDNTEEYKGETLIFRLSLNDAVSDGESLRDYAGKSARFFTFGPKNERLDIVIQIPDKLEVPNARYLDELDVVFQCREGKLRQGNVAVNVSRP